MMLNNKLIRMNKKNRLLKKLWMKMVRNKKNLLNGRMNSMKK